MSSVEFRRPAFEAGVARWVVAHEGVLAVARERAVLERREGASPLLAFRERVHRHLGYGAFAEYTDRHLGFCLRTTSDELRTAEALESLPELARVQQEGRLHASAVRELARVATAETEADWIAAARGLRVREVERLVSGRVRGDHPSSPPRPELEKHVLRFEVSGETLAAFRDATQRLNGASRGRLDDDSVLLLLARAALSWRPPELDAACCDAQHIDLTGADALHADAAQPAVTGADAQRIGLRANMTAAGVAPAGAQRIEVARADMTEADVARAEAQRIEVARVGVGPADVTHGCEVPGASPPRAKQSVPPAVRRQVLLRDRHRCQVPGCRNTIAVDVHHIVPRAEGGTHHAHNQIVICTVHHRAIHGGRLLVSGRAPEQVSFQHPDGTPYGDDVSAQRSDICEKVFRGLCWLGFKASEARGALAECRRDGQVGDDASALLRAALQRLG